MKVTRVGIALIVALCTGVAAGSAAAPSTSVVRNGPLVFDGVDASSQTVQIYRVAASGRGLKKLTSTTAKVWNECPGWSSSGRSIVFDSLDRSTTLPSHIYRMNADGSGRRSVDRPSAADHLCPSPNRSGTRIAAIEYTGDNRNLIVSMNPHGADLRVIARASRVQDNYGPDYAPRGSRLAFYRVTYAKSGVGLLRSDLIVRNGKQNRVITRGSKRKYYSPSWTRDGSSLIAVRGQSTIVSMRPNGTAVRVIASVRHGHISSVVVSPNGKKIAFVRCIGDCGDPFEPGKGSIWVMNANGTGRHAILTQSRAGAQPAGRVDWAPKPR
jgi:Tol biopolymer transport system component